MIQLCPYFGQCGGCLTQHLDYSQQLENKKKKLEKAVGSEVAIFSFSEDHYRNRMDFIFHPRGLGLRVRNNFLKIVNIEQCLIADATVNLLLQETRAFFDKIDTFDLKKHTGVFRYALIRSTKAGDSAVSIVLNEDGEKEAALEKIKQFSTSANNVVAAFVPAKVDESFSERYIVVKGQDYLTEEFLGRKFQYPIQSFFQNNPIMAEKMHSYVRGLLEQYPTQKAHLLDLYAGVGCFGIINADLFADVLIVESVPASISFAEKNIIANVIKNAQAVVLDAQYLKRLHFDSPLFVITDPPRSGMYPKTIQHLNELQPEVIIYISCNVEQLGRDLLKFPGYKVKSVALFDFFPQTNHLEAVVELVKR